jgi:RNA polymerase sigma-70 factor (ECF subfamily)
VAGIGHDGVLPSEASVDSADFFQAHRKRVWGVAYRLTGSAHDADDIVQETFARWIERSPTYNAPPPESWLLRVATNLGIDALRARKHRGYAGPWLPEPAEGSDEDWLDAHPSDDPDPEVRYGLVESATVAFLVALEALGARQRAALLLRDLLGYSAAETATLLGTTEGNVRVLHLRARGAMENYDRARCIPTPELRARHRAALERFLSCLLSQNVRELESLLAESVRTVTDGGGEYTALTTPLCGRARVARFYLRAALNRVSGGPASEIRLLNGLPAIVITLARPVRRQAPRTVISLQLAPDGRIEAIQTVLAGRKLATLHL